MRNFSVFHIPAMAFFSKELYRDVGLRWKGTGFAYLLFLMVLCWVPVMGMLEVGLMRFVRDEAPPLIAQVPAITISNGVASIDAPQPHSIVDPKTGRVLVILDTTGAVTSLDKTNAVGLLTRTEAILRKNEHETRAFSLKEVRDLAVDKDKVTEWVDALKRYLVPVLFPIAVAFSYAYRIILVLIYAAIAMLFANGTRWQQPYTVLVRLTVVAITPGIVISTVLDLAGILVPFAGPLYAILTMSYLFLGLKAVAEENEQIAGSNG